MTIQRLIATHSQPQQQHTEPAQSHSRDLEPQVEDEGVQTNTASSAHAELNQNQLPELNLDLDPGTTLRYILGFLNLYQLLHACLICHVPGVPLYSTYQLLTRTETAGRSDMGGLVFLI